MKENYFSVDVETDGPIPGDNSMLSLGTVVFDEDGDEVGNFSRNLLQLKGAKQHPDTMRFWAKNPLAYTLAIENAQDPGNVIWDYVEWIKDYTIRNGWNARPIFVGYPAGFDFTFVYWYCHHFVGGCPFGFQAIDMKSFSMALLGLPFKETVKTNMPTEWFPETKHTHVAVEDAREQGLLFLNMLRASRERS